MSVQLHVSGPSQLQSGTGVADALELLGYSTNGVTLEFHNQFEDVMVDINGPKVPFDVQYFLQDFYIKCQLIYYDVTVLDKWLAGGIPGASFTLGQQWYAGDLVVQNHLYKRIVVRSQPLGQGLTSVEQCWNFPQCILVETASTKIGTEKTVWDLTWRALTSQNASASFQSTFLTSACT